MYAQEPVNVNFKDMVLVLVVFVIAVIFLLGALANEDPLWFLPFFNETPSRIVVYREGCHAEIVAGKPGFAELTAALNQTLSQVDGYEQGFGLSPDTLKQYVEKGRALQVTYPKRVKIHVSYRFGSPDTLFLPLSDSLGEARAVFGGIAGDYWASALRLKTTEPIQLAAEQVRCP
jgi:hypothetical protein